MSKTRRTFLHLSAAIPSRWIEGRQRIARLTLHNESSADLVGMRLAVEWPALGVAEALAAQEITLPAGSTRNVNLELKPELADEHSLRLRLHCELGNFLGLDLAADECHLKVTREPSSPGDWKVIMGDINVGDKFGFGQILEGSQQNFGPSFNFNHGEAEQKINEWLDSDPAIHALRPMTLIAEHEECRSWHNHSRIAMEGIQKGEFVMGSEEGPPEERPRRVHVPQGFWMGRHPVTQADWRHVMDEEPQLKFDSFRKDSHPMVDVSWNEAVTFCERLTERERAANALPPGYVYRLPTEAEWEYACRAGTDKQRHADLHQVGAVKANGGCFGPVAKFKPNAWGLYDMLGLVFEWCLDAYGPYAPFNVIAPRRDSPEPGQKLQRVVRGGCYQGPDEYARASARAAKTPETKSSRIGFRVVLAAATE